MGAWCRVGFGGAVGVGMGLGGWCLAVWKLSREGVGLRDTVWCLRDRGEQMDETNSELGERKRGNPAWKKGGGSPNPHGRKGAPVEKGQIDFLVEMQWCLDNPDADTKVPVRKQLLGLLKKDVGKFIDRYTALRKAAGGGGEKAVEVEDDEGEDRVEVLIEELLGEWERERLLVLGSGGV